jgi:hypothetical protein
MPTRFKQLGDDLMIAKPAECFSQSDVHPSAMAYVPVANMFASGAEGQVKNRSLQVNLDAHDVVKDYQFNDSTRNLQSTGGVFGNSSVTSTPVQSK